MSAKSKKAGKIIVYVLILLILIGIIGFFAYFTNGFTGDLKTFYVECGDQKIMSSSSGFVLSQANPLEVGVHYTFGFVNKDISGYTIQVLPNQDFDFTVDGETYSFGAEDNFNECFDIEQKESSFTIAPKGGLKKILQVKYPDKEIAYDLQAVDFEKELFKIVITAEDGTAQVELLCVLDDSGIEGVVLDKEVIVF